jgi:glycosyltransferase involved in cell wall biosynthesis
MKPIESVSIVIPMLNEAANVNALVEDLAAQDFRGDVEILVADGGSSDGSVDRVRDAARRHGLDITTLDNPRHWVSPGLNAAIARARGDLIVRLDCHTRYGSDYVRRCVAAADDTGAWSVGPVAVPAGRTWMERAVACAMDSPFGGVHWSIRDAGHGRVEVDAVYLGAFRPEGLRKAGMFDESLTITEDEDLSFRLRRAGGRVVLDRDLRVKYIPQGSFVGLWRKYYGYGLWKVPVMLKHGRPLSARSLAPITFVLSLVALAVASVWFEAARWLLALALFLYAAAALVFGLLAISRRDESLLLLPRVMAVFPAFHVAYGVGMARGWLRALDARLHPGRDPWHAPA